MEEIIIRQRELKEDLVSAINKANLPAVMISPILKDLLGQVNILEEKEYNQALASKQEKEAQDLVEKEFAKNEQD